VVLVSRQRMIGLMFLQKSATKFADQGAVSRDLRNTHEKLVASSAVERFRSPLRCTAVMCAKPSGGPYRLRRRTRRRT